MVSTTKSVANALALAGGSSAEFAKALAQLSPNMIQQLVASGQLTVAQIEAAITQDALTDKQKEAIQTQVLHTTTTTGAAGATKLFDFSLKGLWATMKAFAATHPMITWLTATAVLTGVVVLAVNTFATSAKKQAEALAKAQQRYEDVTSELESLESELDAVRAKMSEIEKFNLEWQTDEEHKKLVLLNDELEREIRLLEREQALAAKGQEEQAVASATSKQALDFSGYGVGPVSGGVLAGSNAGRQELNDIEYLNRIIELVNENRQLYAEWQQAALEDPNAADFIEKTRLQPLREQYDWLIQAGTEAARNNQNLAASISGVTAEGRELKPLLGASVNAWLDLADGVDLTLTKVEDASVELKSFESIVSSLDTGMKAITSAQEDMAETGYLSADSVKALKDAGLEEYLIASRNGYKLTTGALNTYIEAQKTEYQTAITKAKDAANLIIEKEGHKALAINATTAAYITQLKAMQAEKKATFAGEGRGTPRQRAELDELYRTIKDLEAAQANYDELIRGIGTAKRDFSNTGKTDPNKSEFEEKYAEQKHALEMGKKTLKEFNDWLDGEKGYKNYFSDLTEYADEWRKYEKEVFDNVMQLHEQTVADFEHEISLLERVHNGEDALIAKYREEQKYLIGVREAYITTLQAAGRTADEIAKDDWVQELTSQINDLSDAIGDTYQEAFERTSDSLHELLDLTKELIKQEKEDQMDALEDQKDAFSDIIDAKKEMLRLTREEQEYNDKVSKSTKDIAKLQSRIDALSMDDSRQAALEKGKLEEELAELQKELADTQRDHYISQTEDALDKEEDAYHDLMDSKIEEIKSFLDDNEAITNAALKRLNNSNEALFNDLLGYAKHYTDTTEAELTNMWSSAMAAAKRYGDFTSALTGHTTVSDNSGTARRIVADMQANGVAWGEATTDAGRKAYADANLALGKQLASVLGTDVWRGDDGVWYINQNGTTKKLYDVYSYHTGGVVGKTGSVSPKSDELFALLQRDEVVMSRQMVDNTHDFLTGLPKVAAAMLHSPLSWVANAVQKGKEYVLHIHAPLNMEGVLPQEEILSTIKQYPRKVAEVVASQIQKL